MKRLILFLLIVGIVISMAVNTPAQQRVMSANWQAYGCHTGTYDTDWTAVALGAEYEEFEILADSSLVFFVSFASDQSDSLMGIAGEGIKRYFITDTLWVKTKSGDHLLYINKYKRVAD